MALIEQQVHVHKSIFFYFVDPISDVCSVASLIIVATIFWEISSPDKLFRKSKCRLAIYMILTSLFSFGINLPLYFEIYWSWSQSPILIRHSFKSDDTYVVFYLLWTKEILIQLGIKTFLVVRAFMVHRASKHDVQSKPVKRFYNH